MDLDSFDRLNNEPYSTYHEQRA
jgi:hypothetical protein